LVRHLKVLAGVLTALVAAGCGAAFGEPAGVARGVRPSASPRYDRNELAAQTKRALMAQDAVNGLAGPVRFAEVLDGDFVTSFYCAVFPNDEGRTGHVGHERQWSTPSLLVSNVVHGYYRKTGVEGVDQTRTDLLSDVVRTLPAPARRTPT
jgi:hypothetical protein